MRKGLLILAVMFLLVSPALAAQKIAYVDLQKALNLSQEGSKAKQDISALVKKYEAEFKDKQQALLQKKDELQKQAALLSDSAKAEKEREYQQEVKDLQRFQNDVKEELQQRDADYTKRILNEMNEVLQQLGEKGGYSMILEKNEGAVLYAVEAVDLTDELIEAYDKGQ
jgi:outer membrane protein